MNEKELKNREIALERISKLSDLRKSEMKALWFKEKGFSCNSEEDFINGYMLYEMGVGNVLEFIFYIIFIGFLIYTIFTGLSLL